MPRTAERAVARLAPGRSIAGRRATRVAAELSVPRATLRAMTALPLPPQRLPLTVADYVALGEDPDGAVTSCRTAIS